MTNFDEANRSTNDLEGHLNRGEITDNTETDKRSSYLKIIASVIVGAALLGLGVYFARNRSTLDQDGKLAEQPSSKMTQHETAVPTVNPSKGINRGSAVGASNESSGTNAAPITDPPPIALSKGRRRFSIKVKMVIVMAIFLVLAAICVIMVMQNLTLQKQADDFIDSLYLDEEDQTLVDDDSPAIASDPFGSASNEPLIVEKERRRSKRKWRWDFLIIVIAFMIGAGAYGYFKAEPRQRMIDELYRVHDKIMEEAKGLKPLQMVDDPAKFKGDEVEYRRILMADNSQIFGYVEMKDKKLGHSILSIMHHFKGERHYVYWNPQQCALYLVKLDKFLEDVEDKDLPTMINNHKILLQRARALKKSSDNYQVSDVDDDEPLYAERDKKDIPQLKDNKQSAYVEEASDGASANGSTPAFSVADED